MANIHDDAWRGVLTADRLKTYLQNAPPSIIDSPGGLQSVTPLAAACWRGHHEIVQLLLDNPYRLADPNALSPHGRTALFYATTRSPAKDRAAIVRLLIAAGADIEACSVEDGYSTPLMNAITEVRDRAVVHELVDRGASLTKKNGAGMTATTMAKANGMDRDLLPHDQRNSNHAEIVDLLVSLVLFIIVAVNSGWKDVVKDVVGRLYSATGIKDEELVQEIPERDDAEKLQDHLDSYIAETGLGRFFTPGDAFLQNLEKKAAALRDDHTTDLGSPENLKQLTVLSLYQLVIYCDDSASMKDYNRYGSQCKLVNRIARVATKIVPDDYGIELRFINSEVALNLHADEVDKVMLSVRPDRGTPIGTVLRRRILEPLVYDGLTNSSKRLKRPLLVFTITDGCPYEEDDSTFKDAIVDCRRRLVNGGYEPTAVMFCVSQIGDDADATDFLNELRDDQEIKDVLHCTTDRVDSKLQRLSNNERQLELWILKLLTDPIMNRFDN